MGLTLVLLIVVSIVLLTAFYVAAEISIAGSRRSRIQQLHEEGNDLAGLVAGIINSPSRLSAYIATCQISITICSIVLGFVGQGSLADRLEPIVLRLGGNPAAASSLAVIFVLLALSLAQVFFGELIPKNIGIRIPEQLAMGTVRPLIAYYTLFKPFLAVFNFFNSALLRLLGLRVTHEHDLVLTQEEIRRIARESGAEDKDEEEELQWIESTFSIDERPIRDFMTPRAAIFAAPDSLTVDQWTQLLINSPYSRMPLFRESLDHMTGTVHLLDLLCHVEGGDSKDGLIHPLPSLSADTTVEEGLRTMQREKRHLVRMTDDQDATVGIATLEEIIEVVVGDIEDEFDAEVSAFHFLDRDWLWIDARVPPRRLAQFLDLSARQVQRQLTLLQQSYLTTAGSPESTDSDQRKLLVHERQGRQVTAYKVQVDSQLLARIHYLRLP